jgi:hypothetical protein
MEAIMRRYLAFSVLAGATLISTVAAADQQYFNRWTNGSWTNVEYNDGVCHYYYSYNSYDQNMKVNRYGDCSHVAIGPDGTATPVYTGPVVIQEGVVRR